MDLLNLILFMVLANAIPLSGIKLHRQNIVLIAASVLLGFDQEHTVHWLNGCITISGEISGQSLFYSNTITPDLALGVLDKTTQLFSSDRFIAVNTQTNTMYLYMDFLHLDINDIRIYIDGSPAEWDPDLRCFKTCLGAEDLTPRITNDSLYGDVFNGVTFEVRTNGVPIKHLEYV